MEDLWRLSATDIAALVKSKKISAKEAASAALARLDAVNPKINAVVDHRPADVLAQAAAIDAAIARGEDPGPLAGVPVTVKVNIDQEGLCHHQRPQAAARCHREDQQPGDRQSAQGRRRHSRAHQLPGVFLSLVHHQSRSWRHQESARPRHHAGRLVGRGRGGGGGGHRPYRAWHRYRRIDPLSRLCLRRAWPASDGRAHRGLQCLAAGTPDRAADLGGIGSAGAHHRRSQDRAGGDVGLRFARSLVGAGAAAGAGDAEARGAVPQSRRARSGGRSEGRRRRCRQAAGARGMGGRTGRNAAAARGR